MSVKQKKPTPLFLTDNIKMDRIYTNQNEMKNICHFYIVLQVLKVFLIKICKTQPPDLLFLAVFISFYISRYHFSQIFRISFNIIWKKAFCHEFSFSNRFTQTPHPQWPKSTSYVWQKKFFDARLRFIKPKVGKINIK